jgi:chromosome segregation ATPase
MFFPALLQADDQAAASNESKLRDALRNTMLQLQDAQNQMATAQASQAQSDKDNADLKAQIETLKSQMNQQSQQASDDKAAALKAEAALNAQIADQSTEISKLNEALAEWKKAYGQAAQMAALKESERAKMAVVVLMLHRQVDDLETKNLTLFSTANEILTRYEKFSLGEALGAKEPFTGIARVKLEEAVQDYQDKLIDQRLMAPHDPPLPPPLPSGPSAAANVPASSTSTP